MESACRGLCLFLYQIRFPDVARALKAHVTPVQALLVFLPNGSLQVPVPTFVRGGHKLTLETWLPEVSSSSNNAPGVAVS
eukprot:411049-Pelagomonas_calceolata.AAC.3